MKEYIRNVMVVFERPIQINDNNIYGLIVNKAMEQNSIKAGNGISTYVAYLVGSEQFLKNGGAISDDAQLWTLPDGIHTIAYNSSLVRLLDVLMKDIVKYKTYEFDKIEWNDGEIDVEGSSPCFIIKPSLIERYIKIE